MMGLSSMSGPDDNEQLAIRRQEVRQWLAIVAEDIAVARGCIDLSPPRHGAAAFHLQQACEKVMKALLVLAGERLPRTHDLDDLASRVTPLYPQWASSFENMRDLTSWSVAYRYPAFGSEPEPEPTRSEIETTANMVERLAAEVSLLNPDHG